MVLWQPLNQTPGDEEAKSVLIGPGTSLIFLTAGSSLTSAASLSTAPHLSVHHVTLLYSGVFLSSPWQCILPPQGQSMIKMKAASISPLVHPSKIGETLPAALSTAGHLE